MYYHILTFLNLKNHTSFVFMGHGEKSGMTWNLAEPELILNTPPRPTNFSGNPASRVSLMQVTKFFSPKIKS